MDMLRDSVAFDSKLFRSIPKLLFSPGFLTKEFVAGRRMRYIPAVRMYIFISVVAFLIFSIPGSNSFVRDGRLVDEQGTGSRISGMDEAMAQVDSMGVEAWKRENLGKGDLAHRLGNKLILVDHQGLLPVVAERFTRQLPLPLLIIVPILALLMKLLVWRTFYVVHLVFAFHLAAFSLLVFALFHLVEVCLQVGSSTFAFLIVPVYLAIAFKRVHAVSWVRSLISTAVLCVLAFILLGATMLITIGYVLETI